MLYGMFQEECNLPAEYSVECSLYSAGNSWWSTTLLLLPALQPFSLFCLIVFSTYSIPDVLICSFQSSNFFFLWYFLYDKIMCCSCLWKHYLIERHYIILCVSGRLSISADLFPFPRCLLLGFVSLGFVWLVSWFVCCLGFVFSGVFLFGSSCCCFGLAFFSNFLFHSGCS